MSWLFSQALVEEYLGDTCSDGEPSAQSNGNPTQLAYCAPDKMTDFSRLSRFGMTYKPLTVDLGEELLTSYLAGFRAKTSQPQAKVQALTESEAECGEKWHGSFAKYDQDSCSWKTHQCSLLGDLTAYSETWPRWGLMRNGECWEQTPLAPLTNETESGLWQTPTCTQVELRSEEAWEKKRQSREKSGRKSLPPGTLQEQVMMSGDKPCWDWNKSPMNPKNKMWPTPVADDTGQRKKKYAQGGTPLSLAVNMWPTPCATDYKGSGQNGDLRDRLDYAVERGATKSKDYTWPTPRTKGMCGGTGSWELLKKNTTIEEARQMGAGNGGKLNPTWVEWLMGWPLEWTDLKPLETDKFQRWLDAHGKS